jgi:hypothetical protein
MSNKCFKWRNETGVSYERRQRNQRRERREQKTKAWPALDDSAFPAFLSEIYEDFAGVTIGSLVLLSNGIFLQARENPIDRRGEESGC